MNLAVEPTNDIRVRQAIQMALDVEAINDWLLAPHGKNDT